jgi:hypothetical protein
MSRMWKKIKSWFTNDVAVLRPDIPLNRKQRRTQEALSRKAHKRRNTKRR